MKTQKIHKWYWLAAVFVILACFYSVAGAADWPHWRGPNYNGISAEKDWDPMKIKDGVKPLWRASIGMGFSTISVSNGRAYVMGNTGKKDIDEAKHSDIVFCFDAETGKEIWRHSYPQRLDPKYYEGGTLASVTVESGKVYTISKDGEAFCLDAEKGKVIWHKSFMKGLSFERTTWGQSGSPLIIGNLVIYNVGGKGIALDKKDGRIVWESGKTPSGYATAVPFMAGGQKCIALFGSKDIIGLAATTGKELWRHPWKTKYDVNAADPIIVGDMIFVSSGYGEGCGLLKIQGDKVSEVWRNKDMRNKMNGCVLWEGHLYGVDEGGELRCLNFKTGKLVWAQKGFGQGSLTMADGKLIVLGEKGNLVIAEATSEGYKVISKADVLSFKCWSVPVLANSRIYARNTQGDMVCLDVSKGAKKESGAALKKKSWAQWQGPNRDGKSCEKGLLKEWPEGGPKLLWSAEGLGKGFSSVSIADGLIYITGIIDEEGVLSVFDLDGNFKWKRPYGPEWVKSYPDSRCTPTVDEGNVYIISGVNAISCQDAKTGDMKWTVDTFKEFGGAYPRWGYAESPLIVGKLVICTPGGEKATIVALDKKTGQTVWASKSIGEKSSYCSPKLVERGGKKLIVTMTEDSIICVDSKDGNILWRYDCKLYQGKPKDVNPNTPIYRKDYIYVSSGYGKGGVKLKLSEDGSKVLSQEWRNLDLDCHHGGVVFVDGYLYGSNMKGDWVCLNWDNGEVMYQTKGIGKGSVTYGDGMLYCYEEKKGTLGLVRATPEKYDLVSSFKVPMGAGKYWAHPVIFDGRLYIRHGDALMVYDIKAK